MATDGRFPLRRAPAHGARARRARAAPPPRMDARERSPRRRGSRRASWPTSRRGRGNISVSRLRDLARALGCRIRDLVDEGGALRVALLGLRGAGKSTVGQAARRAAAAPPSSSSTSGSRRPPGSRSPRSSPSTARPTTAASSARRCAACSPRTGRSSSRWAGASSPTPRRTRCSRAPRTTVWLRATPEEHMGRVAAQGDLAAHGPARRTRWPSSRRSSPRASRSTRGPTTRSRRRGSRPSAVADRVAGARRVGVTPAAARPGAHFGGAGLRRRAS